MNNYYSITKNIYFFTFIWLMLVSAYAISLAYNFHIKEINYTVYLFQLIADIGIGVFGYLAYRTQTEAKTKKFYQLIFISLLPGLFANEVYNILINIVGIKNITKEIRFYWVVAYTAFLLIQIYAWLYLLITKNRKSTFKNWLIRLPYIQSAMVIVSSLLSIKLFRATIFSEIGFNGVLNSVLEAILFILISFSLSKTKNKSLIYTEVGFLLLIAFNLTHRFSYATGYYFKIFDVAWMISLVIIIFGFVLAWKNKKKIEFFEDNSIHVLTSTIFITFSVCILIIFVLVEFFISSVSLNDMN